MSNFKDLVKARTERDPEFKAALLREIELLEKEGDTDTAEYIKQIMDTNNNQRGFHND